MKLTKISVSLLIINIVIGGIIGYTGLLGLVSLLLLDCWLCWLCYRQLIAGTIPRSHLSEAYQKRNDLPLPSPGKTDDWRSWSVKVAEDAARYEYDPLPGTPNHAVFPYLMDEHDAERMELLLNVRIWPRTKEGGDCNCPRDLHRPWDFIHRVNCRRSPDYKDPALCTCIKKRRNGRNKLYRAISCPIHGTISLPMSQPRIIEESDGC